MPFRSYFGGGGNGPSLRGGADGDGAIESGRGNDFVQIISYDGSSSALRTNGSIAAWGFDSGGHVTGAPTGTGFTKLIGERMAMRSDGTVQGWGTSAEQSPSRTGFLDTSASSEGQWH